MLTLRRVFVGMAAFLMVETGWLLADTAVLATSVIPESDDYVLRTWEISDGLPDNTVSSIAQDRDGYLWLATPRGLARFDGAQFSIFVPENTPGLENEYVHALAVEPEGSLWLSLEGGSIVQKKDNRFVNVSNQGTQYGWVTSFARDREGAIWSAYTSGRHVVRWRNGDIAVYDGTAVARRGWYATVYADTDQRIWVSTTERCGVWDGQQFREIDHTVNPNPGFLLAPARAGGMWGVRDNVLMHYLANGTVTQITPFPVPVFGRQLQALFEDSSGNIWFGTAKNGLYRYHNGQFEHVATSHQSVLAITQDREGNIWLGTAGGGLDRLSSRQFVLRNTNNGLPTNRVVSMCVDTSETLWLTPYWSTPVRSTDTTYASFVPAEPYPLAIIRAMCSDRAGGVWIGGDSGGLQHWQNGAYTKLPYNIRTQNLYLDRQGGLWVSPPGYAGHLTLITQGGTQFQQVDQGLGGVLSMAEDADGRLWLGTELGTLFCRNGEHFDPVPLPEGVQRQSIRFIVPDKDNTLWIGTLNGGLVRWRGGKFVRWREDRGLPDSDLRAMVIDDSGNFWISGVHELFRTSRQDLEALFDGRLSSVHPVIYGHDDDLTNISFAEGGNSVTAKTNDGRAWFATDHGALEVLTDRVRERTPPSPVLIEGIQTDGHSAVPSTNESLIVPPHPERIEIRYSEPCFSAPERVEFRYRLGGVNGDWVMAGKQRSVTFARLPAGNYRFEVQATDPDGVWQPTIASTFFEIRAAWWETAWFRWGVALFCAMALAGLVRLVERGRMQARMRALEQQHALERERTRIARDMHDQVGASLTQIGLVAGLAQAESAEDSPAAGYSSQVVTAARNAVMSLDEIVWAINPRNDTLSRLIEYLGQYTADYLHVAGLRCRLDLPIDIPSWTVISDFRHNIFLIVQEALNNAVKHAAATEVQLSIKFSDAAITMEIADDGCGIPDTARQAEANGLTNMNERAVAMGGTCQIESQPRQGTRLKFYLPLPQKQQHNT